MPKISLCMIVKNEEAVLSRALAGWQRLADELVVVDTGSCDRTIAIAAQAGADLYHYEWKAPGNKGEARNMGLDAATGSWVVVLDADEIIVDKPSLRASILQMPEDVTGIEVLFENYDSGHLTIRWYQPRVFKRSLYRYKHREHELPFWVGNGQRKDVCIGAVFEHRAPSGRADGKMGPMLERLRLDVEEHPEDALPLYFLHRQYLINGEYDLAIAWGQHYLERHPDKDPCECYGNISAAHVGKDEYQEGIRWLHRAVAEQPNRRVWWMRIAELYMVQGQWQIALSILRCASELWQGFEWQVEPEYTTTGLIGLIEKCQQALAASHHQH
jgi:glycosyltransferase involved in cell wall biosynthesis